MQFSRECFQRIKVDSLSWRILAALRLPQIARAIFDPEALMWLIPDQHTNNVLQYNRN
jgi:hypothetical protein